MKEKILEIAAITGAAILILGSVAVAFAIPALIIYVIAHFVLKFW